MELGDKKVEGRESVLGRPGTFRVQLAYTSAVNVQQVVEKAALGGIMKRAGFSGGTI